MSEIAVKINNLSKLYGGFVALNDVNLRVPVGSVVGLIGPNGAGKSSLLKIIAGLSLGTSGSGEIFDQDLASSDVRANIGFMQENNPLPENMRVGAYLRLRAELKGIFSKEVRIHVEKIMRQCDLYYEARHKMIKTLSKGYRQRVGIADAMIGNNKLIILDEPTIGLDPHQIISVRDVISKARVNATMIISSHILHELENVCDYFVIINRGRIVADGNMESLREQFVREKKLCMTIKADLDVIDSEFKNLTINVIDVSPNLQTNTHVVKIMCPATGEYQSIMHKLIEVFGENFLGFYEDRSSLEDIFICATKRCRDE